MKQHLHTLKDEAYAYLLKVLSEAFETAGVTLVLTGGCAVQAHLLSMLGEKAGLRPTDDIDLVMTEGTLNGVLNTIAGLQGESREIGGGLMDIRLLRSGEKRPILGVSYLSPESKLTEIEVKLNISTDADGLKNIAPDAGPARNAGAVGLMLSHLEEQVAFKAFCAEHIIAIKTAGGREKDGRDVDSLFEAAAKNGRRLSAKKLSAICQFITSERKRDELKRKYEKYLKRMKGAGAHPQRAACRGAR